MPFCLSTYSFCYLYLYICWCMTSCSTCLCLSVSIKSWQKSWLYYKTTACIKNSGALLLCRTEAKKQVHALVYMVSSSTSALNRVGMRGGLLVWHSLKNTIYLYVMHLLKLEVSFNRFFHKWKKTPCEIRYEFRVTISVSQNDINSISLCNIQFHRTIASLFTFIVFSPVDCKPLRIHVSCYYKKLL
jgi:hypothetical protein